MSSIKFYKDVQAIGGTRTYYIETTSAPAPTPTSTSTPDNLIIKVYCVETDECFIGTVRSENIQNPSLTITGIHKMLSNALDSKPDYYITFSLDNLRIELTLHTDIMTIRQDITIERVFDEVNY